MALLKYAFNNLKLIYPSCDLYMCAEISRKIAEYLDLTIEEDVGQPYFGNSDYETLPFPPVSFVPIEDVEPSIRTAFVDGGNQEVLGAPNFSAQINRIYFNIFKGRNRIPPTSLPSRIEFYSATMSDFRDGGIFYDTRVFPLKVEFEGLIPEDRHLSFSSVDRTVTFGTQRADIRHVASVARRFAEWELAKHVIENELEKGDLIVHDGSLQTSFTNEHMYMARVMEAAMGKGVILAGISKTSTLFTTTGLSLLGAVQKLAEDHKVKGSWCLPIARVANVKHNAFIYVVKLHESANYVFRYEIYGEQARRMSEEDFCSVTSALASNSKDMSFPGYPYGLVDADSFARVSGDEIDSYRVPLMSELSRLGKWKKISRHICSGDAHSVLDMLKG
ncbi:MAG TPA: DNA double-strand break repair nuclease NurA [candidate division Zixibacteria bacterium]|nr:DNA double-strand break repair nuclease NurA [candidate division Zixibacteria bacterium]